MAQKVDWMVSGLGLGSGLGDGFGIGREKEVEFWNIRWA